ncbi:hypothetical protein FGB62_111g07 [Gracilaria domingensis]|nr:hypothetical protein FGB62_111g07 [Gracilaria domingensis]
MLKPKRAARNYARSLFKGHSNHWFQSKGVGVWEDSSATMDISHLAYGQEDEMGGGDAKHANHRTDYKHTKAPRSEGKLFDPKVHACEGMLNSKQW